LGPSGLSLGCRAVISKPSPKVAKQALNCVKVQPLLQPIKVKTLDVRTFLLIREILSCQEILLPSESLLSTSALLNRKILVKQDLSSLMSLVNKKMNKVLTGVQKATVENNWICWVGGWVGGWVGRWGGVGGWWLGGWGGGGVGLKPVLKDCLAQSKKITLKLFKS
jgi:hypothetical protein